jgi:voltage-gated potassium channel
MNRKRVFEIIEKADTGDKTSLIFDYFILSLIFLNVVAVIAGSYENVAIKYSIQLKILENVSVAIFTIEYLLRFWTAKNKFPEAKFPYIRFIFSFLAVVDLLAILPFYIPFIIKVDLRFLRIIRTFRLFRIMKFNRYNKSLDIIAKVLKREKEKLLMTLCITGILILLAASMMYYTENPAQPEKFPNIIATFWWAIACLTTADYGDVASITFFGKILSGVIALLGIGLVALPSGIMCSGLIEEINAEKNNGDKKNICPHCGKEI